MSSKKSTVASQEFLDVRLHPLLILMFFCLTAYFAKLSNTGLMSYDDAYYAEKGREILVFKDFFTIHYNYRPSFDTAPLYYWLEALAFMVLGVRDYAACLPSALLGTASVALLYFWVRRETNSQMAFVSALVLATIPHFSKFSRHAMLDVTLTFFTIVSLYSFFEATKGRRQLYLLWGVAAAAGMLTKSVLGTFPIWIGLSYLVLGKKWSEVRSGYFWLGLGLAFLLGTSWYVGQYWMHGEAFVNGHIRGLLMERALLPEQVPDIWYRLKYVLMPFQYMPHWCLFMVLGLWLAFKKAWQKSGWERLVVLWLVIIMGILSLCANTKTWYLMSALPALAIMGGMGIDFLVGKYAQNRDIFYRRFMYVIGVLVILFNILATSTPFPLGQQREVDTREFSPYVHLLGQAGYKLISYKADFFSLNNASLFYSDYAFTPIFEDRQMFLESFRKGEPVAAMVLKKHWPEVQVPELKILKSGDDYVLVANQSMDFSGVQVLKSRWMK